MLAFLAGLLIGSFLNVCVFRLPRDLSVVRPRSFCPGCEKQIAWYDNIPVVSYAAGGNAGIARPDPLRYLVVELATGAAFALWRCWADLVALKWRFSAILITLTAPTLKNASAGRIHAGRSMVGYARGVVLIDSGIVTFFCRIRWGLMASVA